MKQDCAGKNQGARSDADRPAIKVYSTGTHRVLTPAQTIERARPHLGKMGITRIGVVTGLDRVGIPVVMVTRPNARSVAVSQGKGLDLDAAKASALMESIETWHAEHITRPVIYGTFADLAHRHKLADPDALAQVRDSFFNASTRILWIEGINLIDQQNIWVPFEMVHTDYTQPGPPGHGCFHCSTNGLASGNHILEAQCHAICEVIERDATTIWHHLPASSRAAGRLILNTVDDPECCEIIERLTNSGLDLAVWETTSDAGVPAFYGLVVNGDGTLPEHIGAGAGCHPCKAIALSRTLTEAAQTRLTYISGARDDLQEFEFYDSDLRKKHEQSLNLISNETPQRCFGDISNHDNSTLNDDLECLIAGLTSIGIDQVISIDLTNPDINIPVVRLIIPGLEAPHDDDDYVPGTRVQRLT